MTSSPIFFFHGLESTPTGRKYQRLSESFDITSPDFQEMDIRERLDKAERVTRDLNDIVVVGSSFGGLLAALLYNQHPERFRGYVLMAPALHQEITNEINKMPSRCVVLHGTRDEVVPIEAVRSFCAGHDIEITEVDDGHRLHQAMEQMVEAVQQILSNDQ